MSTILDFLGSDHRACDDLFEYAEAAVAQKNWGSAPRLSQPLKPPRRPPELMVGHVPPENGA